MDALDLRTAPDPGMYGCDRELFAQIWRRVAPGEDCPVELSASPSEPRETPAPEAPSCPLTPPEAPSAQETAPVCLAVAQGDAAHLQALTRECLVGAAAYRAAQRGRRRTMELASMAQKKTHHAKRLSAAGFLMTGVRYWPAGNLPISRPADFFALLRERFLAEQRLHAQLTQLAQAAEDACLRELYLTLAEETMELVHTIRLLVERAT